MTNILETLEATAARGAEGLAQEARADLAQALCGLQRPDGGFAGLDGRSDPYFSLFAWLSLRALGAAFDRDGLCGYMVAHRRAPKKVEALCAELLLAAEGRGAHASWLRPAVALWRGDWRDMYAAFLLVLATGRLPRWVARAAWWRERKRYASGAGMCLPTPRLAAGLVLAKLADGRDEDVPSILVSRRGACGGFASASGAPSDLLATAVARFSLELGAGTGAPPIPGCRQESPFFHGKLASEDLAFVEACWMDDGLFGPSPGAEHGDAEHTFYGLLALGTCR